MATLKSPSCTRDSLLTASHCESVPSKQQLNKKKSTQTTPVSNVRECLSQAKSVTTHDTQRKTVPTHTHTRTQSICQSVPRLMFTHTHTHSLTPTSTSARQTDADQKQMPTLTLVQRYSYSFSMFPFLTNKTATTCLLVIPFSSPEQDIPQANTPVSLCRRVSSVSSSSSLSLSLSIRVRKWLSVCSTWRKPYARLAWQY